jgi:8-oxo-dGTP pyrophosphatase MutT (NUDIX family)
MAAASSSMIDYQATNYRAFVFVLHDEHGILLLRCTRKKNKPDHWQIPGGRIDEHEFLRAGTLLRIDDLLFRSLCILADRKYYHRRHWKPSCLSVPPAAEAAPDRVAQLLLASKLGAARELFEETGIDVRSELDRLLPPFLHPQTTESMPNESEHRIYYFLIVTDDDFPKIPLAPPNAPLTAPMMRPDGNSGQQRRLLDVDDSPIRHVRLRLSHEHSGFTFQVDTAQAAIDIQYHSGGKNSVALRKALQIAEPPVAPATQPLADETPHNNESSTTTENQQQPEQSDAVADETTLLAERNQSVPDLCAKLRSCFRWC